MCVETVGLEAKFGKRSWVPWCVSVAAEVASALLNESCKRHLSADQRAELKRRWLLLGVFALWPPFFDAVFRSRAGTACYNAIDKVPLVRQLQSLPPPPPTHPRALMFKPLLGCVQLEMLCRLIETFRKYHFNLSRI